jgi:hypothetical protein
LVYTKATLAEAKEATQAAKDAVIVTKAVSEATIDAMTDGSRRELRAYVGVESIIIDAPDMDAFRRGEYSSQDPTVIGITARNFVRVRVKNYGQTPAFDTVIFCYWALAPQWRRPPTNIFDSNDTDSMPAGNVRTSVSKFLLQATQHHDSYIPIWDLNPMGTAMNMEGELFLYGRIYYRDAFGKSHRTKFCFEWQPEIRNGTSYVPYEEYNGEDDKPAPI